MANENELLIRINGTAKDFIDEIDKVKKETKSLEKVLTKTAKASAVAFAVAAAGIALVTKAFADYETALVGVGKTTNIEGKKLEKFGKQFQKLSSEIPVATNELLGIAQAAGQLGVKGEKNLLKFTETVAKLGVATDLTGEQAAISLTRILNVTGEAVDTIDNFGSVIVALGNNFAATESEIVRMATEVSRSTAVFGVSAAQAAGLSTALKSVGVQAQLGGSATGRAFREIDKAIRSGGQNLQNLSAITGILGADLKQTFEKDATSVFQAFINGLGKIQKSGGSTTEALAAFNLKGDEILKVLPVLAKNSELVGRALKTAADETENATALNEEAAKAFDTLNSEAQITQNLLTNIAAVIGEEFAPQVSELLKSLNATLKSISELDKETIGLIASFLKWTAIITGTVASLAALVKGFLILKGVIAGTTVVAAAFGAFVAGLSAPVIAVVAGIGLLTAAIVGLTAAANKDPLEGVDKGLENVDRKLKEVNKEIDEIQSKGFGTSSGEILRLDDLKKQQEELRKVRQEAIRASKDFGTGEVLLRPKADKGFSVPDLTGDAEQTIPLRAEEDLVAVKNQEDKKTKLINNAQDERLQKSKDNQEILLAQSKGAAEEELGIIKEFQDIEKAERDAKLIQDEERRAIEEESILLRHDAAFERLNEFLMAEEAQREEFRRLTKENDTLADTEKDAATKKFNTASAKDRAQTLKNEQILSKQRLQNERKLNDSKLGLAAASGDALIALTGDNAIAGLALSKSVAVAQAFIDKARADTGSLAQSRALPIGVSETYLAQALAVNGTQLGLSLGTIAAQSVASIARMQTGGVVPNTGGGARDRVNILAEPGELIIPKTVAPNFVQAAGIPDTQSDQAIGDITEGGTPVIEIVLEDRASEVISLEQREGRSLGIIND